MPYQIRIPVGIGQSHGRVICSRRRGRRYDVAGARRRRGSGGAVLGDSQVSVIGVIVTLIIIKMLLIELKRHWLK